MIFNSLDFLLFLPVVLLAYMAIPHRWRWVLMLAASYWFYMAWRVEYIVLILVSTAIDYMAARGITASHDERVRRRYLIISILTNLGILGFFKYYNFLNGVFGSPLPATSLLLPVGISFYTFQSMSYTIDVYRGRIDMEPHLGRFALYVSFFPQLVAGPIERARNLLPQLRAMPNIQWDNFTIGAQRALFGFFKKVVIADRLAPVVNTVYASPESFEGPQLILATVFFAVQIYCDFSGYSDIAIGVARMFGVRLMQNFDRPYLSKSISEFWSRWHISLSTWFRDYVYIPLGGNRATSSRVHFNVLVTFLLSGFWHGANWTFIVWGGFHGVLLVAERILRSATPKLFDYRFVGAKALRTAFTFALVLVGWVFFRADTLEDAITVFSRLPMGLVGFNPITAFSDLGLTKTFFIWAVLLIFGLFLTHWVERRENLESILSRRPVLRWTLNQALLLTIAVMGVMGDESQFIYFQF